MAAPDAVSNRQELMPQALSARLLRVGRALGLPLASLIVAFFIGGVVIGATRGDPIRTYQDLICGGFGLLCDNQAIPGFQLNITVLNMTPLILAGLAVAIAFRAGLFNIGAQGQYLMGILACTVIGVAFASWPGYILLPLVLIAGALAGAFWAGIAGVLKALTGAHEVVTTIMLNAIALLLIHYLVGNEGSFTGPLKIKGADIPASSPIGAGAQLPRLVPQQGQILGLPGSVYTVHAGIIISLVVAVLYWFLVKRTSLGYEIGAVGQSPRAARYAGISARRTIIVTMLIAGAFAGLAGAIQISGLAHQLIGNNYDVDTTGFDGLAVALLGQGSAIGIVLSALLFAGMNAASSVMQTDAHVSSYVVAVLQGLILLCIAANFLRSLPLRLPSLGQRRDSPTELPPESPTVLSEENVLAPLDTGKTS
jgi:simple sugar transport system permease protein